VPRLCAIYALIGLLVVCPFVCGAAEVGHATTHAHPSCAGSPGRVHGPAHCPESCDNCICEGAIQPGAVRVLETHDIGLPYDFAVIFGIPLHCITHLAWDATPPRHAHWGGHPTVRALLQNYRC
jgi:hypothetical protein